MKTYPGLVILCCLYLTALILIGPLPNEPICDTWAYGKITKHLLQTGKIVFLGSGAMNLVWHIIWGGLFCIIPGFSFTALHASTLILSFAGSIGFYLILKELGIKEPRASIGSLLLIANPIFFILSFSFMTDVPFLSWVLLAILCYLKSFREKGNIFLFLGSLLGICAFLVRQNGIFIPLSASIVYLAVHLQRKRLTPIKLCILIGLPLISTIAFLVWQSRQPNVEKWHLFLRPLRDALFILTYMGLFCLPLLLGNLVRWKNFRDQVCAKYLGITLLVSIVVAAHIVFSAFIDKARMPYLAAWLTEYGVFTNQIIVGDRPYVLPPAAWWLITILVAIATTQLLIFIIIKAQIAEKIFFARDRTVTIIRKSLFIIGLVSAAAYGVFVTQRDFIFALYARWYNTMYRIGYVKKTLQENYPKIAGLHQNMLIWLFLCAVLCLAFYWRIRGLAARPNQSRSRGNTESATNAYSPACLFVYLLTTFNFLSLLLMKDLSDRYLLILIPGFLVFILRSTSNLKFSKAASVCAVILFFAYSAVIASDTFAWNRAAWQAGEYLKNSGIPSRQIDAGLAWNGWYFTKPISYMLDLNKPRSRDITTWYLGGMFSEIDNEYTVSSSGIKGYEVLRSIEYESLLTRLAGKKKNIYILHRLNGRQG